MKNKPKTLSDGGVVLREAYNMPNLYIIAGCNGAGKTTASFTILPEMLNCKEFVNADSIAAGLSPFNPESVAIEAGRLMLSRIHDLMQAGVDFAFETTLATRSYVSLVKAAQHAGYNVTLLFIWLDSPETAIQRVTDRVAAGGHHIPEEIVRRRYHRGIYNLINLYIPVCNSWIIVNNKDVVPELIAKGTLTGENIVQNYYIWDAINAQSKEYGR
ncbi:zeta toxin family protein [Puia sp. P3]|uniref:zeta toxin family protein n=1 Tax=Puia sp. P3 TaxID=3423952 RepID=UPI003D673B96